jgi:hypothetical protein
MIITATCLLHLVSYLTIDTNTPLLSYSHINLGSIGNSGRDRCGRRQCYSWGGHRSGILQPPTFTAEQPYHDPED